METIEQCNEIREPAAGGLRVSQLDTDLLITLFSNVIMVLERKNANSLLYFILILTMLPRLILNFWVHKTLLLILWGNQMTDVCCQQPAWSTSLNPMPLPKIFKAHIWQLAKTIL